MGRLRCVGGSEAADVGGSNGQLRARLVIETLILTTWCLIRRIQVCEAVGEGAAVESQRVRDVPRVVLHRSPYAHCVCGASRSVYNYEKLVTRKFNSLGCIGRFLHGIWVGPSVVVLLGVSRRRTWLHQTAPLLAMGRKCKERGYHNMNTNLVINTLIALKLVQSIFDSPWDADN